MPFAELPGSTGFVAPQAPSWAPFAAQAIDLIGHQQPVNTAELVQNAVGQINKILEMSSPEAKLEREMKMTQLQFMKEVYANYREHPELYQMTAKGPILKDPIAMGERVARLNQAKSATALNYEKLRQSQSGGGISNFINSLTSDANKRFGSKEYNDLPVNPKTPSTSVSTPDTKEPTPDLEPSEIPDLLKPEPSEYTPNLNEPFYLNNSNG